MAKNTPKVYHHSNVKGTIIKIVAIVIAAAFILALTAFFGFRKFAAYTDTGKLYLDIPWLYGYMDGPPEHDDLAPYLAPVETAPPAGTTQDAVQDESPVTTDEPVSDDTVQSVTHEEDDNAASDDAADPQ